MRMDTRAEMVVMDACDGDTQFEHVGLARSQGRARALVSPPPQLKLGNVSCVTGVGGDKVN
jgi:hypothetical protein